MPQAKLASPLTIRFITGTSPPGGLPFGLPRVAACVPQAKLAPPLTIRFITGTSPPGGLPFGLPPWGSWLLPQSGQETEEGHFVKTTNSLSPAYRPHHCGHRRHNRGWCENDRTGVLAEYGI